jgi:hypothetical protein
LTDVQADEFSFNFLGHSGKFYYEGSQGWKVVSDENVQVQLNAAPNDFLSSAQVNAAIQQYAGKVEPSFNNDLNQTRAFNSFTLTTDDGTRYFFGGAMRWNSIALLPRWERTVVYCLVLVPDKNNRSRE